MGRPSPRGYPSNERNKLEGIPKTIGVKTTVRSGSGASKGTGAARKGNGLGPPVRVPGPFHAAVSSPPKIQRRTAAEQVNESPAGNAGPLSADPPEIQVTNTSFDTAETNESDLPVIASANELREYAKAQGHRRSSLLQEHLARVNTHSSSNIESTVDLDEILDNDIDIEQVTNEMKAIVSSPEPAESEATPRIFTVTLPEHTRIAQALVEAHKKHVDIIMETLKVEMDALKEFELTILEEGPLRPTEDEVLEYFESVGLCLEQRAKAGAILQKKMDKISKGDL
jgi:hypothetical protein